MGTTPSSPPFQIDPSCGRLTPRVALRQTKRCAEMARRRIFTTDVISRIPDWRDQGLSVSEMADRIGCTSGTLRVKCSQLRISLRGPGRLRTPPTLVCCAKHGPVRAKVPIAPLCLRLGPQAD